MIDIRRNKLRVKFYPTWRSQKDLRIYLPKKWRNKMVAYQLFSFNSVHLWIFPSRTNLSTKSWKALRLVQVAGSKFAIHHSFFTHFSILSPQPKKKIMLRQYYNAFWLLQFSAKKVWSYLLWLTGGGGK